MKPGTAPPTSPRPLPFDYPLTFEVTRWRPGRKVGSGVNTGNRDADDRSAPGNSGEPKALATRGAEGREVDRWTRKAVEMALASDVKALRLYLERLGAPCRETPVNLNLPRIETGADTPRVLSFLLAGRPVAR